MPKVALDALARRLAMGAETHGENNWRRGGKEFRKASINHLMRHLLDYIEHGNANDNNTDAIICNAAFLCHFEAADPFAGCDPQPPAAAFDRRISIPMTAAYFTRVRWCA